MVPPPGIFGVYVFLFTFLSWLVWFLWNRLRNPFWSIQPVFHYWWLPYWLYDRGIVRADLPRSTRFLNQHAVKTWTTGDLSDDQWREWTQLVQTQYHWEAASRFSPALANIQPYFIGHEAPCYCSMYLQPNPVLDVDKGEVRQMSPRVIGAITSRPLNVTFCNTHQTIPVYYVDYLCVDTKHRKKGIAPQLIQTHEYNQSHRNRAICVSLFKREEELTGIVPITCFQTVCFPMPTFAPTEALGYAVVPVSQACAATYCDGMSRFRDAAGNGRQQLWIAPSHGNQMNLICTGNWQVYMLLHLHRPQPVAALYFFRDTCIQIGKSDGSSGSRVLSCFAAVRDYDDLPAGDEGDTLFLFGFQRAVAAACKPAVSDATREKKSTAPNAPHAAFGYLAIEGISDTALLTQYLRSTLTPIATSLMAYYFYNFVHRPIAPERCVVLT